MTDKSWALQRKLMRAKDIGFNSEVYRWFKDADHVPSRLVLRDSLLIQAKESRTSAMFKITYFREFVQQCHLKPDIYGIPVTTYHESVAFHPQIELYFSQDLHSIPEGKGVIDATINFRLMHETSETINRNKVRPIAISIAKTFMVSGQGITFAKGKNIVSYIDPTNGYHLQIYASSKSEGIKVIRDVLSIQNHEVDEDKIKTSTPEKRSSNNPRGKDTIYGEQVDKARWRPTANVRFRYASLKVSRLFREVILVDATGKHRDALVKK